MEKTINDLRFLEDISNITTYKDMLKFYVRNKKYLPNLEINFCLDVHEHTGFYNAPSDKCSKYIKNLYATQNIKFLNDTILKQHILGLQPSFELDLIFSFDSNFASYIHQYRNNGKLNSKNIEFLEIIDWLIDFNYNYDYMFYGLEVGSKQGLIEDRLLESILSLKIFNTLDKEYYKKYKKFESIFTEKENRQKAKNELDFMKSHKEFYDEIRNTKDVYYILLLHIISLQFKYKKEDLIKKIESLLYFMQDQIGAIFLRILHLSINYFQQNNMKEHYLKTINKGMSNPLMKIEKLSWDLTLLFYWEGYATRNPMSVGGFLPCMITMDEGFAKAIDNHKIKAIVKHDGDFELIASNTTSEYLKQLCEENFSISHFFEEESIQTRRLKSVEFRNKDFSLLRQQEEQEVISVLKNSLYTSY